MSEAIRMSDGDKAERLSFMFGVPEVAKAAVAITSARIYYTFATVDSIEEGELPGPGQDFEDLRASLLACFDGEEYGGNEDVSPLRVNIYRNNVMYRPSRMNLRRLQNFVNILASRNEEFLFLENFLR